jgi:hypothetical protein
MPGTPIDAWPLPETPSASSDEVAKQALQDAARHEEQLVKLLLVHDDKALRVLSVYVPVIVALTTGAVALNQAGNLTLFVGLMIGGTATTLFFGCVCAIVVLWTKPIYLPSRKPLFWNWALEHNVDLRSTAIAYVAQSIDTVGHNERHSDRASGHLMKAYACGIAAPMVGAAIVWVVYSSRT